MAHRVGVPALLFAGLMVCVVLIMRFTGDENNRDRGIAQIVRIQNRYVTPVFLLLAVGSLVVAIGAAAIDALT